MAGRRLDVSPVTVYRQLAGDPISFGDMFESGHLIDIFVQSDTSALGGAPMPRGLADKIAGALSLELEGSEPMVPLYSPAIPPRREQTDVLGQGTTMKAGAPVRAILLSDSCAVDSALAVEREARRAHGRLLFAPIIPATPEQVERLRARSVFGRFPLPGTGSFDGGIADLARCFMVDVRAIEVDDCIMGLTEEAAEDLEVAWHAYALRRGPLVTEHNLAKLAPMLAGDASDAPDPDEALEMIGQALNAARRLEVSLGVAADAPRLDADSLDGLVAELTALGDAARLARERLARTRPT